MGVASGCGEQEVGVASGSGWNLWVWLLGVVERWYIDFLILLIPTPLVSVLFYSSIPTFWKMPALSQSGPRGCTMPVMLQQVPSSPHTFHACWASACYFHKDSRPHHITRIAQWTDVLCQHCPS